MRSRKRGSRQAIELLFILLVICGLAVAHAAAENWDISEIDGDGIDNDGDGYTDSDDTECPSHYEGYGIQSTGGQGGQVYWVDISLGDLSSDPRSGTHADPCGLRKALEATGTRVVKFINGGTITLNSGIRVRYGNITIDGFTCPSPGVTITHTAANHGGISLTPNNGWHQQNYILNHLKFDGLQDVDGGHVVGWGLLGVDGDIGGNKLSRMILDHLTLRDLEDKFTLWGAVETVTLSNSLFYNSGLATLISFYGAPYDLLRTDISYHHNVWAENGERNPQLRGWIRNLDYVNNVIFDWDHYEGHPGWGYGIRIKNEPGAESIYANIINNYFYQANSAFTRALIYGWAPGPDYADGGPATKQPQGTVYTGSDMGELWVAGNILPPQNIDEYSTISGPLPIPAQYQVTTVPATQLYLTAGQVGMQYRDARDDAVIGRVIAAIAPDIQIVNREIFYNNCAFDGNDPAANASDDGAIATDKQPLLSGNVATVANYTS